MAHESQADRMNVTLLAGAAVLARGLSPTPNDGMATVESAIWGDLQGCIPADHWMKWGK